MVLNSMVLKLSNTRSRNRVYANCVWRCFRKEESSSLNPQPCEVSLPALSLHLQGEAKLVAGLVQFCPIKIRRQGHLDALTRIFANVQSFICVFWGWLTISQLLLIGKTNLWCVVDLKMVFQYDISSPVIFNKFNHWKFHPLESSLSNTYLSPDAGVRSEGILGADCEAERNDKWYAIQEHLSMKVVEKTFVV